MLITNIRFVLHNSDKLTSIYSQFIWLKTEKHRNKDICTMECCRPIFFSNELYIHIDAVFHALSEHNLGTLKNIEKKLVKEG